MTSNGLEGLRWPVVSAVNLAVAPCHCSLGIEGGRESLGEDLLALESLFRGCCSFSIDSFASSAQTGFASGKEQNTTFLLHNGQIIRFLITSLQCHLSETSDFKVLAMGFLTVDSGRQTFQTKHIRSSYQVKAFAFRLEMTRSSWYIWLLREK